MTAIAPPAHTRSQSSSDGPVPHSKSGSYRWRICALLFFATTINYLDRLVIGLLAPDLQKSLHWTESDYSNIVTAFQIAYAIGLLSMGKVLDRVGVRRGYAIGLTGWSLAGMAHAFATGVWGFASARFALGLAEAANFPAAIKTIAQWFPKRERAFATGIFNSGANIGSIIAPVAVPYIAANYGWQWAFIATGALGFIWLAFWLSMYQPPAQHARVSAAELAWITSDGVASDENVAKVPWSTLLRHRETLTICVLKFVTDPAWWFLLFWLPKFLNERHGVALLKLGPPMVIIYLVSDVGSVAGGWFSSWLIKRGHSVDYARKTAILASALCALPIFWASQTDSLWLSVALVSIAAAAHQACSANIFTLISDVFPQRAVGSVVGLAGFSGAVAGAIVAKVVGFLLERTGGNYVPVFAMFSVAYITAWFVLRVGIPRIEPIDL